MTSDRPVASELSAFRSARTCPRVPLSQHGVVLHFDRRLPSRSELSWMAISNSVSQDHGCVVGVRGILRSATVKDTGFCECS